MKTQEYGAAPAGILSFIVIVAFLVWGFRGIQSLGDSTNSLQVMLAYTGVGMFIGLLALTAIAWIYVLFRRQARK